MSKEDILIGQSPEVPMGAFVVVRVKNKKTSLLPEDIQEMYLGDGCQASLLFGWGIARHLSETDTTMMVFNPKETVTFPEVEDEGDGE